MINGLEFAMLGVFILVFLVIFAIGEVVRKKLANNLEISRKITHLLGGLTALAFPYCFSSHWTVLILSSLFCFVLWFTKKKGILKSVHEVGRASKGGFYFPIAIYLIFLFSSNNPVIYFISILVMSISDSMAAIVGGKYGQIKFDVEGNVKSLEGSVAFFFVTFLCVQLPLLLMTNIGRVESVLIAFIIALLVTGFEAISMSGSDNIFVPFGTYYVLAKMTKFNAQVILQSVEILLLIIAFTVLISLKNRLFKASGLIGLILLNYAAVSLCNFFWLLPLLLAQLMYYFLILVFVYYEGKEKVASHQIKAILYISIIPTIIIFIANTVPNHMDVYLPYLTAITSQVAIIANFFFSNYLSRPLKVESYLKKHRKVLEMVCASAATLVVAVLPIMVYFESVNKINSILIVVIGTWFAYMLNFMMNKYYRGVKQDIFEYRRRLVSAAFGVLIVFVLQKYIIL